MKYHPLTMFEFSAINCFPIAMDGPRALSIRLLLSNIPPVLGDLGTTSRSEPIP